MKEIFTAVPCQPCDEHKDLKPTERALCPRGCGLADYDCYWITWDGPGLGLVCENNKDGKRKAFMMNEAWYLAKGMTIDETPKRRLKNKEDGKEEWN